MTLTLESSKLYHTSSEGRSAQRRKKSNFSPSEAYEMSVQFYELGNEKNGKLQRGYYSRGMRMVII